MSKTTKEKNSDPCPCPACGKMLTSRKAVPKHTNGCPEWCEKFPDVTPKEFNFDAFYKTGFWQEDFEEGVHYVKCQICLEQGIDFRKTRILHHVKGSHHMTKEQYLKLYPEALTSCSSTNKKRVATVQERFGVDNVFQSEEIKAKFDVRETAYNSESRKKRDATNLQRYGHENPLGGVQGIQRAEEGMISKYGTSNPRDLEWVNAKIYQAHLEKYGDWYLCTEDFKEKSKETCLDRYGVEHFMQSEEGVQLLREVFLDRYGVSTPMGHPPFLQKCLQNRTFESPNKLEQEVDSWSDRIFFTGDGQVVFYSEKFQKHKNPDFVVVPSDWNGDLDEFPIKKCVEVFGDYWHGPEITGMSRKAHESFTYSLYEDLGIEVLILWERFIRDEPGQASQVLELFIKEDSHDIPTFGNAIPNPRL